MPSIAERISTLLQRHPAELEAMEVADAAERRDTIIAELRALQAEHATGLVPLEDAVQRTVKLRDAANAAARDANVNFNNAVGIRDGHTHGYQRQRERLVERLRADAPASLHEARAEAKRRLHVMTKKSLPEGMDMNAVFAVRDRLNRLETELLDFEQLTLVTTDLVSQIPDLDAGE